MTKKKKSLRWWKLDNAAKIYPAARRKNWSNVFRQSVTLYEEVDISLLKSALEKTIKRFPSIATRLRKGLFWYYLEQVAETPEIKEEYSYPLSFMDKQETRKCAFRVIVYKNRIAVEFFHSLTDGTGAMIFLKTLTAEYLEQKYSISIPKTHGVLDTNQPPSEKELEDSFLKYAGEFPISRKDTDAWHMEGSPLSDGFLQNTCLQLPIKETLALAHKYNSTLTVFLSAVMMRALLNMQKEKTPNPARRKRIKLLIPVNLRSLFPSDSLRNFAMYTVPELDARLGDFFLEEICEIIKHKMGTEITQKHMSCVISTNVKDEKNMLLRLVPLPIKNAVMKAVFNSVGERKSCLTFSNIGLVKLPDIMDKYISRFDFILGVQASAPYNCGMVSYKDTIYINFIRNICEAELETNFFLILRDLGIPVLVQSNQR